MIMESIVRKTIKLITPQDVKEFCFAASELPRNVSAIVSHNEIRVDAKSILGVLSLNLSEPVILTVTSEDNLNMNRLDHLFKEWEV
jgi:hypothetical protein